MLVSCDEQPGTIKVSVSVSHLVSFKPVSLSGKNAPQYTVGQLLFSSIYSAFLGMRWEAHMNVDGMWDSRFAVRRIRTLAMLMQCIMGPVVRGARPAYVGHA